MLEHALTTQQLAPPIAPTLIYGAFHDRRNVATYLHLD